MRGESNSKYLIIFFKKLFIKFTFTVLIFIFCCCYWRWNRSVSVQVSSYNNDFSRPAVFRLTAELRKPTDATAGSTVLCPLRPSPTDSSPQRPASKPVFIRPNKNLSRSQSKSNYLALIQNYIIYIPNL